MLMQVVVCHAMLCTKLDISFVVIFLYIDDIKLVKSNLEMLNKTKIWFPLFWNEWNKWGKLCILR